MGTIYLLVSISSAIIYSNFLANLWYKFLRIYPSCKCFPHVCLAGSEPQKNKRKNLTFFLRTCSRTIYYSSALPTFKKILPFPDDPIVIGSSRLCGVWICERQSAGAPIHSVGNLVFLSSTSRSASPPPHPAHTMLTSRGVTRITRRAIQSKKPSALFSTVAPALSRATLPAAGKPRQSTNSRSLRAASSIPGTFSVRYQR